MKETYLDITIKYYPIFKDPYTLSLFEGIKVKTHCKEILDVGLIKLSNKEYACATVMPSKKDIFVIRERRTCVVTIV